MYRILTRGDDGDVEHNGRTYYSATFRTLEEAQKKCTEWSKTSFTFIQKLKETKSVEVWEDIDETE